MGGQITKYFKGQPPSLIVVGLDAVGKTTMLYKVRNGKEEITTTIPTIGMNVETLEAKVIKMTAFDMGGRCPMRPLWRHYYAHVDGVVFVVDSNDRDRLLMTKCELERLLSEEELKGKPILFLANKQDLPNAVSPKELTEKLDLSSIKDRPWYVVGSVCTTGSGLFEGLDWISSAILTKKMSTNVSAPLKETASDGKKLVGEGVLDKLRSLFIS
jgi:small GTP-binding protein